MWTYFLKFMTMLKLCFIDNRHACTFDRFKYIALHYPIPKVQSTDNTVKKFNRKAVVYKLFYFAPFLQALLKVV